MGEIPPSTRSTFGFSAATAWAASLVMSANVRHSGSISKAQCDLLFGSFQNITASIMVTPSWALLWLGWINRVGSILQISAATNIHFRFRMTDDREARATE